MLISKPSYVAGIGYDIERLEIYCNEIVPVENEIADAEKERTKYVIPPKTVEEIKKELQGILDNDLIRLDAQVTELVEKSQTGYGGAINDLFMVMKTYLVIKDLSKNLDLIKNRSKVEGAISQDVREAKIKKLVKTIAKAKAERMKIRPLVKWDSERKYVERWRINSANYANPTDAGGLWLSKENPTHQRLLAIYEKLKLGELPKNKMFKPLMIDGKEFPIHPGHHFQGGNVL